MSMDKPSAPAPAVSVLMGVLNCADTLSEALDSLERQSFSDWELIVCDDGSTDATRAVIETFCRRSAHPVTLLVNKENRGLNHSLNRCLRAARGKYLARMDGDDRCAPERFAIEISALEQDPSIAFVSTDMLYFDEGGAWGHIAHPTRPTKRDFLHGTPFCHAPSMLRREAMEAVGGYSEEKRLLRVEDYHLWMKLYRAGYCGENLHLPLYEMRDDRNAYGRRKLRYRLNEFSVRCEAVKALKLPLYGYVLALRPLAVGLLPGPVYDRLHRRRLQKLGKDFTLYESQTDPHSLPDP